MLVQQNLNHWSSGYQGQVGVQSLVSSLLSLSLSICLCLSFHLSESLCYLLFFFTLSLTLYDTDGSTSSGHKKQIRKTKRTFTILKPFWITIVITRLKGGERWRERGGEREQGEREMGIQRPREKMCERERERERKGRENCLENTNQSNSAPFWRTYFSEVHVFFPGLPN